MKVNAEIIYKQSVITSSLRLSNDQLISFESR